LATTTTTTTNFPSSLSGLKISRENKMATLLESIQDKYVDDSENTDYGFIVFVSNSPECKKGMFPPIMTLSDYDINRIGKS
jgi:hypothetical protein